MLNTKSDNAQFPYPADERPLLTVDTVIFTICQRQLQTLLVRQNTPPFEGAWALPGGFVRQEESLDEAARRELAEETGVTGVFLEQLYTFGRPDRDPRARVVSVAYFALVAGDKIQLNADAEATGTAWHPMYALPETAFDHKNILAYALQRLRYKLEYTAIAFRLLPEEFTLSEIQDIYAIILDKPDLDKRNFRKKLLKNNVVIPTTNYRQTGGRPARLYRFSDAYPFEHKAPRLFP